MRSSLERTDWALLGAFLLAALLGTWTRCLLFNDGAVLLSAGWLGNAWDLFFNQFAGRAVSHFLAFGPAWIARLAFDPSSSSYMTLAHALYFAMPLALWLVLRVVEPHRLFSRLYLAIVLALIYFPTELIAGTGLWLIWMALIVDPARSARQAAVATLLFGAVLVFTHAALALMSLLYVAVGVALSAFGRPVPRRSLVAAAAMSTLLFTAYLVTSRWLPVTNPTMVAALATNRYNYVDPVWVLSTLVLFPMLVALWLLLLAPGAASARLRWRLSPAAVLIIAVLGAWFAAAGTGLLTWLFARNTAPYVLALALALALVSPSAWLVGARRPLMLYAGVTAIAFLSYNVDLFLFGRFVDRYAGSGVVDVEGPQAVPWPSQRHRPGGPLIYFKWAAGPDYVGDVVVPVYDWYRLTLAFYSYFRSDRQRVLFHPLGRRGDWLPFECAAVERARRRRARHAGPHVLDLPGPTLLRGSAPVRSQSALSAAAWFTRSFFLATPRRPRP